MKRLDGKVALVTGGSRGIGAAIAKQLAVDGARVAITYASSEQKARELTAEIEAAGGAALAIQADNRNADAVASAVETVVETYGGLDILVNNAGIFKVAPIAELTLDDFDETMEINVRAPFLATRAAAEKMRDGGRIVTIGSNLAKRVPWPGISLYALSKSALIGLTRGAARDLGERNITVNVVHPGSTDTDMNPAGGEAADTQRGTMAIPRFSKPQELASLVAWLAGPDAGTVTGSEFTIDSGTNA